jgi:hypothetical protein
MDDERAEMGLGGGRPGGPRQIKPVAGWRVAVAMAVAIVAGAAVVALIAWMFW